MSLSGWHRLAFALCAALPAFGHDGTQPPGPQPPAVRFDEPPLVSWDGSCRLTIRLVDAESGAPVAGVFRLSDDTGRRILVEGPLSRATALSPRDIGPQSFLRMDSWSVAPGPVTVSVPRGLLRVEAFRGPNSLPASVDVDTRGLAEATAEAPIAPLSADFGGGWETGNCHLHVQGMTADEAERYLCDLAAGDGYDRVYLSYLERAEADAAYISNTFTSADLERFSARSGVRFGYGEEYRHNFARNSEGYGHVMFLDLTQLILPASLGEAITKLSNDDFGLRPGIERARAQAATILWCHAARGTEDIPNWVSGLVDVQMLFDTGNIGSYGDALYPYLNIGLRVPLATGTDWFFRDASMTCVMAEEGADSASWLEALRAGRSFITNGPLLELTVNGAPIGSELTADAGDTLRIEARALCRGAMAPLELVHNGAVVATAEARLVEGRYEAALSSEAKAGKSGWYAVRTMPLSSNYDHPDPLTPPFNDYGKPLFAHSSPIYVTVGGRPVYDAASGHALLTDVLRSEERIASEGAFSGPDERDAVLKIYRDAAAVLRVLASDAANGGVR